MIAPAPFGPPILCEERIRKSPDKPSDMSSGMRPAACTASMTTMPPGRRTIAAISATGWITPVSLLAACTATSGRPASRHGGKRWIQGGQIEQPLRIDGRMVTRSAEKRPPPACRDGRRPVTKSRETCAAARGPSPVGRQQHRCRLGRARGEDDMLAFAAAQSRHLAARGLDHATPRVLPRARRTGCRRPSARPSWPRAPLRRAARWHCGRDRRGRQSSSSSVHLQIGREPARWSLFP
jgi:hypothetical protein